VKLINWIVSSNSPLSAIKNEDLREMIGGRDRNDMIKSVQTLRTAIEETHKDFISKLKHLFESIPAIALTADAWTSYKK